MSEQPYPYEALLAFCQTKGPAFDGFMRDWNRDHQQPTLAPLITVAAVETKPVKPAEPVTVAPAKPATNGWGSSKKPKTTTNAASPSNTDTSSSPES